MVIKEVRKWKKLLNLEVWDFKVTVTGVPTSNFAEVDVDYPYLRADLGFNLDNIKDMKTLRQKVIHEMMHIILAPYTDPAAVFAGGKKKILADLEENLITQIERWELWGKVK